MCKIRDGSTYLDDHLCANDYYAEGEQVIGQWSGRLAERLGLRSGQKIQAGDRAFQLLRENVNPATGEKLTQRNVEGSIRFFDFQCSAQKSISILYALTGDERLAEAHDCAAAIAFAELEGFAACRVRTGAAAWSQDTRTTGNVCAAEFGHDASRALDPQLHKHFVVVNATWDEQQNRMVALESCEMVKAIRYAGKVYQNALAREVKALGYDTEESRDKKGLIDGFEIRGVSPELQTQFSKRRAEVEAGIKRFEQETGRTPSRGEITVITRETRSSKMAKISTPAVRASQLAQLSDAECERLKALALAAQQRADFTRSDVGQVSADDRTGAGENSALEAAVAHRYERASVLRGHDVLAEALNTALGTLDLQLLKQNVRTGNAGLVALDKHGDLLSRRFSTREGLALEQWSCAFVNDGIGCCPPLRDDTVEPAEWLAGEQRDAVRFVCSSRDQVMAIRGVAGAGKTTMLKELHGHLAAANHKMLYLAPTASAVQVLKDEGFPHAMTVSAFLVRTESGKILPAWKDAIVVVDEVGLSSNRQGAALLRVAGFANQRVVLLGDSRQHSSVDAGDFLRVLESHSAINSKLLTNIRRQIRTEYNRAIQLLAHGQAAAGMEQIDQLGWIQAEGGHYLEQAATEYLRLTGADSNPRESVLLVAPTWRENHELTKHIRAGLRTAGKLGETRIIDVLEPLGRTMQQKMVFANYQKGQVVTCTRKVPGGLAKDESLEIERIEADRLVLAGGKRLRASHAASFDVAEWRKIELAVGDKILLRANRKKSRLINGDVLTIAAFGSDGSINTIEGKTIPADYRHFAHGYAITSHKSQGRTTDHVVVAAERLDAKSAYVACSRGKVSCTVYTPTRESLFAGLPHSADRESALDVLRAQDHERQRKIVQSNNEAWHNAVLGTAGVEDHARSQSFQARGITDHTPIHYKETKTTDQETHTYVNTIRSTITRTARAIVAAIQTIAGASRELAAGKYCLASASRELEAGRHCLARATRSRRVEFRAIDQYHRRRSRGLATVRVELVQTIGSGLDHEGRSSGDNDQRQPNRLAYVRRGGPDERADGRDRSGSEPTERRETSQSTSAEVTTTSNLPTDLHHEASDYVSESGTPEAHDRPRKGRRGM